MDDELVVRDSLARWFAAEGYETKALASAREALDLADREWDLALLDIKMPGMDGLEVLRRMRSRPRPPPVTILTAHATATNTIEAMRIGAFDHLTKPIGREALARALNAMLAALADPRSSRREAPQDGLSARAKLSAGFKRPLGCLQTASPRYLSLEKPGPERSS